MQRGLEASVVFLEQTYIYFYRSIYGNTGHPLAKFEPIWGWYDGYIYKDHEKTLIYETELRPPRGVQAILSELNLIHLNDWSLQYNSAKINKKLWKIKPYVIIQPIRLPDGLPTDETTENFRLFSNGELVNLKDRVKPW